MGTALNTLSAFYAGANAGWQVYRLINTEGVSVPLRNIPYRPKEWANIPTDQAQLIYVRDNIGGYFFDAILRTNHSEMTRLTRHPVQNGAALSDHAYDEPSRLTMEVAMSDAMDQRVAGQFKGPHFVAVELGNPNTGLVGGGQKSISAYQVLKSLKKARQPLMVVTRLETYRNMLIASLNAPDDVTTAAGLRCTVILEQIIMADVPMVTVKTSSRPQVTGSTAKGAVQPVNPSASQQSILSIITDGLVN